MEMRFLIASNSNRKRDFHYSSNCILSCANSASRLDSSSDSLSAWSSAFLPVDGDSKGRYRRKRLCTSGKKCASFNSYRVKIQNKPSRFDDETVCNGGVPLMDRRLRSLSFRFLSFFFFFMTGVVGVSGESGSTIGDGCTGESNDTERDALRCFFFFDFFRLSLVELIELVDLWKIQLFIFIFCCNN